MLRKLKRPQNAAIIAALIWLATFAPAASAITLNLTASCGEPANPVMCTLSGINTTFADPLQLANATHVSLQQLFILNSVIGRMPREIFAQAPQMHGFHMHNCGLNKLVPEDFQLAGQLRTFSLLKNRLFDMPDQLFRYTKDLNELLLVANTIRLVHRGSLRGLKALRFLDMQQNSIQMLPEGLFADLVSLEHIDLSRNELATITTETFAANTQLKTILLADNKFNMFAPNALEHLPHLRFVDLAHCYLEQLSVQSVDTLLVEYSHLTALTITGGVGRLNAANNELTTIAINDKLSVLELNLHGNRLDDLAPLEGMTNLQRLDVSANNLQTLCGTMSSVYLPLPSLLRLDVSANNLRNLSVEGFLVLNKLTHLDVSYNTMGRLDQAIFEPLISLEQLSIEGNNLHSFDFSRFLETHSYVRELGIFLNDWSFSYNLEIVTLLKERGIKLSKSAKSAQPEDISMLDLVPNYRDTVIKTFTEEEIWNKTAPAPAPAQTSPDTSDQRLGVGGIHPYWTKRDVFAMLILAGVAVIILLQVYTILKEEDCLPRTCCWLRRRGYESRNGDRRLHLDEDDSEM